MATGDNFLESPILFFLYNKVDVMSHDDLVSLCSEFYTVDEVKEGKETLHRVLNCEGDLIERRGDQRKKSVSDMVKLLLTLKEPINVKFCVTKTRRLPPVSLDHIDVAALMKNLLETRTELLKCQHAQKRQEETLQEEFSKQRQEIDALKQAFVPDSAFTSAEGRRSLGQSGAIRNSVRQRANTLGADAATLQAGDGRARPDLFAAVVRGDNNTNRSEQLVEDSSNNVQADRMRTSLRQHTTMRSTEGTSPQAGDGVVQARNSDTAPSVERVGRFYRDQDGFMTRAPRNRNRPESLRGTKQGNKLRVAPSASRCHMWVYNLHVDYTAAELEAYVKEILEDEDVTVNKPQLRRTDSSAFVVVCQRRHYETLMSADSWEENARVRPYRLPRATSER